MGPVTYQAKCHPIVFLAPGAGLGHLVRTGALALGLSREEIPTVILSSSAFSHGFADVTGLNVIGIPASRWKDALPGCLADLSPRLIIQDSFPLGFRGEDLGAFTERCPLVFLSRRLKMGAYLDRMRQFGAGPALPRGLTHLIVEPLSDDHLSWLEPFSGQLVYFENRIRFPLSLIRLPQIPDPLNRMLDRGRLHLVVHSGPTHEVDRLIRRAEEDIETAGEGELAVINPLLAARGKPGCFDYFPAVALYPAARRIYTGGGYNCVAEGHFFSEKHVMLPFYRLYDDQFWRVEFMNRGVKGGTP